MSFLKPFRPVIRMIELWSMIISVTFELSGGSSSYIQVAYATLHWISEGACASHASGWLARFCINGWSSTPEGTLLGALIVKQTKVCIVSVKHNAGCACCQFIAAQLSIWQFWLAAAVGFKLIMNCIFRTKNIWGLPYMHLCDVWVTFYAMSCFLERKII